MEVVIKEWSIKKLMDNLDIIQDQPIYQRGKVWTKNKNQLLIDSMFRDIDLPKFYFREIDKNGFKYEVADGQQRLHAIRLFHDNDLALPNGTSNGLRLSQFGDKEMSGLKFHKMDKSFIDKFNSYKITIAFLKNASNKETRTLFGRLQQGSTLNPAEKRNAIISPIGQHIDSFVFNHSFFDKCKIPLSRYRHQDYLAHVFALVLFKNQNDLKAELIEKMYLDENISSLFPNNFIKKVSEVLDKMSQVDMSSRSRIKNKFSFIDIFYLLFSLKELDKVDLAKFTKFYDKVEKERLEYKDEPEVLLNSKSVWDNELYRYIYSYQNSGYSITSIDKRSESFRNMFNLQIS